MTFSNVLHVQTILTCPLSSLVFHLSIYSTVLSLKPVSIHPPLPSHSVALISLLLPLFPYPCLAQTSTMAIMTHLPVKLLPVETARPWHRTQCLSASLLKSFKSQVDIILTATGITPPYNASIFSRSPELKASKQWAPIGQMRHKVDQAAVWEKG